MQPALDLSLCFLEGWKMRAYVAIPRRCAGANSRRFWNLDRLVTALHEVCKHNPLDCTEVNGVDSFRPPCFSPFISK